MRLPGERDTVGEDPDVPEPLNDTACGEPAALSTIESDALNAPVEDGENSTDTVQVAAAASVAPHVVADLRNEEESLPVMVSDVKLSVAVPEFLIVTTCAAVVEPMAVDANVRELGVRVTAGPELAVFTLTVSSPKSVHCATQAVRLNTTLLILAPD